MSDVELAVLNEREACAKLLEDFGQDRQQSARYAPNPARKLFYLETADLVMRLAQLIRERESIAV